VLASRSVSKDTSGVGAGGKQPSSDHVTSSGNVEHVIAKSCVDASSTDAIDSSSSRVSAGCFTGEKICPGREKKGVGMYALFAQSSAR